VGEIRLGWVRLLRKNKARRNEIRKKKETEYGNSSG
jgi:hypothetical protein